MNFKKLHLSTTAKLIRHIKIYDGAKYLYAIHPKQDTRGDCIDIGTLVFDGLEFSHAYLEIHLEAHDLNSEDIHFLRELASMELYALQLHITYDPDYHISDDERFERASFTPDHEGGGMFRIGPVHQANGIESIDMKDGYTNPKLPPAPLVRRSVKKK